MHVVRSTNPFEDRGNSSRLPLMEFTLTARSKRRLATAKNTAEAADERSEKGVSAQDGAIQKSQRLIRAFPPDGSAINLTTLANRAGLAKSTAHRTLGILVDTGVAVRTEDGYRLGSRMFELAQSVARAMQNADLRDRLLPYLLDLYERTHETVYMGILRHDEVLCSQVLYDRRGPSTPLRQGQAAPAAETAAGHALLAYSPAFHQRPGRGCRHVNDTVTWSKLFHVRRIGIAVAHAGGPADVIEIAAPVLDANRYAVCAFTVSAPRQRLDVGPTAELVRRVTDAASRELRCARRQRA